MQYKEEHLYPNFMYWEQNGSHYYQTTIRFERDSKWYLTTLAQCFNSTNLVENTRMFMQSCYERQLSAKVNDSEYIKTPLDDNQISEADRLKREFVPINLNDYK